VFILIYHFSAFKDKFPEHVAPDLPVNACTAGSRGLKPEWKGFGIYFSNSVCFEFRNPVNIR
jgi:hypothetical protein